MLKKIMIFCICIALMLCITGCKGNLKYDKMVREAIDLVMDAWEDLYRNDPMDSDGTVQIRNTRVIVFDEEKTKGDKYFEDVAYIVEFVIFSDYYGTEPYYVNIGLHDCVIVYEDGTMKVCQNYIKLVYSATYRYPTELIDEVIDFEDKYNTTEDVG